MQIPRKPVTGENIKKYIFDTFSSIIDYLHASKIRPGNGIEVRETPCGTVISIIPRGYVAQGGGGGIAYDAGTGITISGGTPGVPDKINANIIGGNDISVTGGTNGNPLVISYTGGGGGGGVGIDSAVSGGTATVYLDGGTGSVVFIGENGVSISGGTGGEVVISGGTGGGGGVENTEYVWFGSVPPVNLNDWIIEAQPNKIYNLYEEYIDSSSFIDYVYTTQWIYDTYGINADDGGNILVKLPTNLSASCMVKIYAWKDSRIVVIAPDGKHILDDNGTNTDSSEGFSGACLHVYVYQPNNSTYGTGVWRSQHFV